MNDKILDLLIKENEAWDDMITRQGNEIPDLEKMLAGIIEQKKIQGTKFNMTVHNFKEAILDQDGYIKEIKEELAIQQHFLKKEKKKEVNGYEINTLISQNFLRDRIKMIEKKFLDLKSNFLNYYVTVFL
jgi:hypothetical protein